MHNQGRDLLSELPSKIIHSILALVPIGDVVRTSILSRKWRYTWASLPQLNFDDSSANSKYVDEEGLKNFITQALCRHKEPIHKFKLSVSSMKSCRKTDHWLLCLSENGINDLSITIQDNTNAWYNRFRVHSNLYYCQKLSHLNLYKCEIWYPPPPTFKGFSCLRSLDLQHCCISSNTIENLVANSPPHESLVLINSGMSELRISTPNLKHLCLFNANQQLCLYAPLLTEMLVGFGDVRFTNEHLQEKSPICKYTRFLGGFMNLQKLVMTPPVLKCLSVDIESCHHSLVFHHLKIIQIDMVNFEGIKERSIVYRLITAAPNLHELEILIIPFVTKDDELKVPHVSLKDFGWTPNFTFKKLRVVKMAGVRHLPCEMEFIEFLLRSSPVLEMISVHHSPTLNTPSCNMVKIQNLSADLLMYSVSRASPNAKILFGECSPRELLQCCYLRYVR